MSVGSCRSSYDSDEDYTIRFRCQYAAWIPGAGAWLYEPEAGRRTLIGHIFQYITSDSGEKLTAVRLITPRAAQNISSFISNVGRGT